MEIHQKISMPNYQKLKTMGKRSIDQKLRLRNSDARNEKLETGAVVASRRRLSGVEKGQGICCQWKAKRSVFERRPMQFPARQWWACEIDTKNRSILWATNTKRLKCVEKYEPQRPESVWEDQSEAVQRWPLRHLHQITLIICGKIVEIFCLSGGLAWTVWVCVRFQFKENPICTWPFQRYVTDIFMIWCGSDIETPWFADLLDAIGQPIGLNCEISSHKCRNSNVWDHRASR